MVKLENFYKNKKILITGATGFKGAWYTNFDLFGSKVLGIGYKPIKIRIYLMN